MYTRPRLFEEGDRREGHVREGEFGENRKHNKGVVKLERRKEKNKKEEDAHNS